jgi:hypothetical protein
MLTIYNKHTQHALKTIYDCGSLREQEYRNKHSKKDIEIYEYINQNNILFKVWKNMFAHQTYNSSSESQGHFICFKLP